jgi:hypothetical protein
VFSQPVLEDLREPGSYCVPSAPLGIELHLEIPGNLVVSKVVLTVDVVVGSEGTVSEDDVQKSPFHLSTIFKETLPLRLTKGEVHHFSMVAAEKSNCVRCLLRCTPQGPAEK